MKRTRLTNASILALALVASPVMAQTSTTTTDQTTTQPQTDQTTTQPQTETTTPSSTEPTTTTESSVTSTPATSTDQSLPATGSPMPTVIAVSLAAMALGAWLSRPQPRI